MVTVRIVQISDTHLSHRRAYSVPNVTAVLEWLAADPPDLVVHTGDVTADDPDDEAERAFAHDFLVGRDLPLVALAGNHDVGGFSADLFTAERGAAFVATWGTDVFSRDVGEWRVIGANVYRLGQAEHDRWLADALATDRPIALFLHQPVCLVDPGTPDEGDWSLPMQQRRPLLDLMASRPVRVVASGHLHRYRAGRLPAHIDTVWCPAASFIGTETADGSRYVVGAVEHLLHPDGRAAHRLVEPPAVEPLRFADFAPPGAETIRETPLRPLEGRQ
jgi:3',5'-cyclic AMP phosphodiesterase CpdA